VSQKLFGLVLSAEAAGTLLDRDPVAARDQVERLQALAQDALEELRSLVFELRPLDLALDGLGGALRKHVGLVSRLEGLEIELTIENEPSADPARDLEVLRIAQEALQNAVKHSHASHVTVVLRGDGERLLLEIDDDGVGFDPAADGIRSRRLGLTSMEERAERIGGTLEIRSAEGIGTTVRLEAPDG
jgi:signal transduction histidine kinase